MSSLRVLILRNYAVITRCSFTEHVFGIVLWECPPDLEAHLLENHFDGSNFSSVEDKYVFFFKELKVIQDFYLKIYLDFWLPPRM